MSEGYNLYFPIVLAVYVLSVLEVWLTECIYTHYQLGNENLLHFKDA